MPIRTGRLWKQCTRCQEMYEAHTVKAGICDKCNPRSNSFLNILAKEKLKHKEAIRLKKLRKKHEIKENLSKLKNK